MSLYQNKYRRESIRLQNWDYGWNGAYFITICCRWHICHFGYGKAGTIHLSELGLAAKKYWFEIPAHFPFVQLGSSVVMPNHVHGIIIINKPIDTPGSPDNGGNGVATQNFASLHGPKNRFGPQSKNMASIIRGYKTAVTKYANTTGINFEWQERFWDHIIRDRPEYDRIEKYIINNMAKWDHDEFYNPGK